MKAAKMEVTQHRQEQSNAWSLEQRANFSSSLRETLQPMNILIWISNPEKSEIIYFCILNHCIVVIYYICLRKF